MPDTTHRPYAYGPAARPRIRRIGRIRRRTNGVALALATAAVLLTLTGCGGGSGGGDRAGNQDVASLPSSAATTTPGTAGGTWAATPSGDASATTAGGDSPRPQERLDDTPEERQALIQAWDECLVAHGAQWTTTRSGVAGGPKQVADPVPSAASAACEDKLPMLPPELDPARNAHYRDDMLAEIACLRAHGVMVHLVADTSVDAHGLGWTYDSSTTKVPSNEARIENDCQLAAFGGKGK